MPFNYKSPGVYVEEVDKGARPIEAAGTAVLSLIGFCRDAITVEKPSQGLVTQPTPSNPTLVTNWTQFVNTYGDLDQAVPGFFLHKTMFGFFHNGGTAAYVVGLPVHVEDKQAQPQVPQLLAGEGFLSTAEGRRTLRLSTPSLKPDEEIKVEVAPPETGAPENSFSLVVRRAGGDQKTIPNLSLTKSKGLRYVGDVLAKETENLVVAEVLEMTVPLAERLPAVGTSTALAPMPATAKPVPAPVTKDQITTALAKGNAAERKGIAGLEAIDEVTLLAFPDVLAAFQHGLFTEEEVKSIQTYMIDHCEAMKDRFAILDCPANMSVQDMIGWRKDRMNFDSKYAALYYPWIKVDGEFIPPSGHIAGVYARVDGTRGVHKAPANEKIAGVVGLERNVSRNEQDMLNPIGVNCIRSFPGQGIRIWGARTLASDAQWRYINVRRLFCNVEESILQGTSWIVFEPNDQVLWRQIKRDITAFLTVVWRSGALFGRTPEEAFFIKCDEETNPKELRDLGYCVIEVGLSPVKPAEFVVFRISQKQDGAGTTNE